MSRYAKFVDMLRDADPTSPALSFTRDGARKRMT